MIIYCLFQICNIALAVLGFFTVSIAVYLITLTKNLNTFNSLFFIFGVALMVLSYFGCKLRDSPTGNLIYSICLSAIFVFYLILTACLFAYRDTVIKWIMSNYDSSESSTQQVKSMMDRNVSIANDLFLLILVLLV